MTPRRTMLKFQALEDVAPGPFKARKRFSSDPGTATRQRAEEAKRQARHASILKAESDRQTCLHAVQALAHSHAHELAEWFHVRPEVARAWIAGELAPPGIVLELAEYHAGHLPRRARDKWAGWFFDRDGDLYAPQTGNQAFTPEGVLYAFSRLALAAHSAHNDDMRQFAELERDQARRDAAQSAQETAQARAERDLYRAELMQALGELERARALQAPALPFNVVKRA